MAITDAPSAPLVTVTGATGRQGGSVVQNLIESDKPYRIRAFTRDPSKPNAQSLAKQGVEVVALTVRTDNTEEIAKALAGTEILFGTLDFWAHMDPQRDFAESKALADAAKAVGVKLYIWSGLPDMKGASKGKYDMPQFDIKASVTSYARSIGLNTVDVQAGWYLSNWGTSMPPTKLPDGSWIWSFSTAGTTPIPVIHLEKDYGLFVRAVIESPDSERPEEVRTAVEEISMVDLVGLIRKESGANVSYAPCTQEQSVTGFKGYGIPDTAAEWIVNAFVAFDDPHFGYFAGKKPTADLKLARPLIGVQEWVKSVDWSKIFV